MLWLPVFFLRVSRLIDPDYLDLIPIFTEFNLSIARDKKVSSENVEADALLQGSIEHWHFA